MSVDDHGWKASCCGRGSNSNPKPKPSCEAAPTIRLSNGKCLAKFLGQVIYDKHIPMLIYAEKMFRTGWFLAITTSAGWER
jgi:hypothetical protein